MKLLECPYTRVARNVPALPSPTSQNDSETGSLLPSDLHGHILISRPGAVGQREAEATALGWGAQETRRHMRLWRDF